MVDFGPCSRLRPADHRAVAVRNTTRGKLTVYPSLPRWQDPMDPAGEPQPSVFQVRQADPALFPADLDWASM